jgi:hypothetical protein
MPKFVDSSYVIYDAQKLRLDIDIYHTQNLPNIYNNLKKVFVDKEIDNYQNIKQLIDLLQYQLESYPGNINILFHIFKLNDDDLTSQKVSQLNTKLEHIWKTYQTFVERKQFFVRQSLNEIISVDDLLDKCAKKGENDKEMLHNFLNTNLKNLVNISANQISPLWNKLTNDDYMETPMRPFYRNYQHFVVETMSRKYERLYKNFAGIFFKVTNRTMDMDRLNTMVSMINNIETNKITQHNASVIIGEELGKQYIDKIKPNET